MRRFIITGAPGAGKTAIIRQLELDGFSVVDEAATDVIAAAQARGTAEPWTDPPFIDVVAHPSQGGVMYSFALTALVVADARLRQEPEEEEDDEEDEGDGNEDDDDNDNADDGYSE